MMRRLNNQAPENLETRAMSALRNSCDDNGVWNGLKRPTAYDNGLHWMDFAKGLDILIKNKRIEHYNGGYRIVGYRS